MRTLPSKSLSAVERAALKKKGKRRAVTESEKPQESEPPKDEKTTIEQLVSKLQKQCNDNIASIKSETDIDFMKVALVEAEQIWFNTQILMKSEQYSKMTDEDKINLIQKDYKEFYKNFPIVSRYMICLGQYDMNAFKKMLIKCNETRAPTDISPEEKKTINEKLWIERQADYVKFLYEEINKDSVSKLPDSEVEKFNESAKNIWQQSYDSLQKEFDDFKILHEEAEKKIKEDATKHKKELLFEMGDRIVSGKQNMDINASKQLLAKLKDKVYKQRFDKSMKELFTTIRKLEPNSVGDGQNKEARVEYDSEIQQSFYKKNYKKADISKFIN